MMPADPGRASDVAIDGLAYGAANDDQGPVPSAARELRRGEPVGWDPFEVWRTRVRDARSTGRDAPA